MYVIDQSKHFCLLDYPLRVLKEIGVDMMS
jgi:hypothetical protein